MDIVTYPEDMLITLSDLLVLTEEGVMMVGYSIKGRNERNELVCYEMI
jgi:hypothetical protein